jgi:hypothetical protein
VRGDSLRDLYAKALALLGLGLLGAAGALVDYWPVRSDIPQVASVLALPPALAIPTVSSTSFTIEQSTQARHVRAVPAALIVPTGDILSADGIGLSLNGADQTDQQSLVLDPAEARVNLPPSLAVEPLDATRMPVSPLDLTPPAISAQEVTILAPAVQAAQNGDNMFAGAAKKSGRAVAKTGSAIANGVVSGASSVASAFGAFGRMFRF